MLIKKLDYLSPKITLYYSNSLSHKSVFSGILTLLHYCILLGTSIYYVVTVFRRKNQTSFYFRTYVEDPGIFEINQTSFFHYLILKGKLDFDPKAITIIGAEISPDRALGIKDVYSINHWRYSKCDFTLMKDIDIIKTSHKLNAICITSFYNSTNKKVYQVNEEGYINPTIQHGIGNEGVVPYGIFLRYCQNDTNRTCYDREIIETKFTNLSTIQMNILDPYVDVKNFHKPFVNYINSYEIGIMQNAVMTSYGYFNPSMIKTFTGLLVDSFNYKYSYSFSQEVRSAFETNKYENNIAMFFFYMYNHIDSYERKYMQFVDMLAIVSGIFKFSSAFFLIVNQVICKYMQLNDFGFYLEEKYKKMKEKLPRLSLMKMKHQSSEMNFMKNNFLNKTFSKTNDPDRYLPRVTFKKIFMYLFRTGNTYYVDTIDKLRKKIISEERMVKNYLSMKNITRTIFTDELKKSKTLALMGTLYGTEVPKNILDAVNRSKDGSAVSALM